VATNRRPLFSARSSLSPAGFFSLFLASLLDPGGNWVILVQNCLI
jgi:hypothetical protein